MKIICSVIIPVGPSDSSYKNLVENISSIDYDWSPFEFIFVGDVDAQYLEKFLEGLTWSYDGKTDGRAPQQNRGATLAQGKMLWFLHCDSRLTARNAQAVLKRGRGLEEGKYHHSLFYFQLYFYDKNYQTIWNEWGAFLRCLFFQMAYGDQGLFIAKKTFTQLGNFPLNSPVGEDFEFIWICKYNKVKIVGMPLRLGTSARKYYEKGWGKLSRLYAKMTWSRIFKEYLGR